MTTQEQINQIKGIIANLEGLGNVLIQSEIDSMKRKLADLEAKLLAEIQELEAKTIAETQEVLQEIGKEFTVAEAKVSSFWAKYGYFIAHCLEVALLAVIITKIFKLI